MEASLFRQLKALSVAEWRDVVNQMNGLHSIGTRVELQGDPTDDVGDYLLEGIYAELRRRGLLGRHERLQQRHFPPDFRRASAAVRRRLDEIMGAMAPAERHALGCTIAECTARWLKQRRVPVTRFTMMRNVDKVFVALDFSFPGYLEAGLLRSILPERKR